MKSIFQRVLWTAGWNKKKYRDSLAKSPAKGVLADLSLWIKDGRLILDGKGRESSATSWDGGARPEKQEVGEGG